MTHTIKEWKKLHCWCSDFRYKHDLIYGQFLVLIGAENTASNRILLSPLGLDRYNNNQNGRMYKLYENLRESRDIIIDLSQTPSYSILDKIRYIYFENIIEGNKIGIEFFGFDNTGDKLIVRVSVKVGTNIQKVNEYYKKFVNVPYNIIISEMMNL